MRTPEQRLWDKARKNLTGYGVHMERIENRVGTGQPDTDMIVNGIVTKVELKAVDDYPKRDKTPVLSEAHGLNQAQKNWAMEWRRYGGRSLILIGVGASDIYAIEGRLGDEVNQMSQLDLHHHSVARKWSELAIYLGVKL